MYENTTIVSLHLRTYTHTPTKHNISFMWCDVYIPVFDSS